MNTKIVTAQNIDEILAQNSIIFLDFWASWCEPCKIFGPIFDSVANKNLDLFFGKVNVETEQVLSTEFQIRSIPSLIILKEGTIIYFESGNIPEYALNSIVARAREIDVSSLETDE